MKKIAVLLVAFTLISSCKNEKKIEDYTKENLDVSTSVFPDNVTKVFNAHGGYDTWNAMSGLYYEIEREDFMEKHTVNLKSRKSIIEYKDHLLGFDGENVWLKDLDTVKFKSNPRFYYNLMFYFYAMPFILGDDGINYGEAKALEMDGKSYPGILITYESGIGESPEDEYILYYDPDTYKMTWLGYTVTYFSKEKSKEFHFIKYSDWQTVKGLVLPKTLQWYNYEDNKPTTHRNDVNFVNLKLSTDTPDDQIFAVAEDAKIIE